MVAPKSHVHLELVDVTFKNVLANVIQDLRVTSLQIRVGPKSTYSA